MTGFREIITLMFLAIVFNAGCDHWSSSSTNETEDSGSDSEGCSPPDRRCFGDILQECEDGQWVDWIDCSAFGEHCADIDGQVECSDADTDTTDNPVVDSNCPLGELDDYFVIYEQSDVYELAGYTSMTGGLLIECSDCVDLGALECLQTIGYGLHIENNDLLTNLEGLDSVKLLGEHLYVKNNPSLTTISNLSALESIAGGVYIAENSSLTSLDGLGSITSVENSFGIVDNDALTNIEGLGSLTSVGGSFGFDSCESITNLDALSSLNYVGEYFGFTFNENLPDCDVCDVLDQLTEEPEKIEIYHNLDDECTPAPQNCP